MKVSRKTIMVPRVSDVVELNMLLWDLAGSEEFTPIRASYLGGAAGAVIVCDLTRLETFTRLGIYLRDFYAVRPDAKVVLAANKWDLDDQHEFDVDDIASAASEFGLPYFLTSAKDGRRGRHLVSCARQTDCLNRD